MELSAVVQDIRINWAISDAKRDEGLTTPEEIERFDNISYGPHGVENLLDIYRRKDVAGLGPTIVNIHGGGWVYGCKEIYQFYCMSLAKRGFVVVNINYRLAPESRFPAALEDINAAMKFIEERGADYGIDKDNLVMVGDSAGGQLVSHYAAILTNQAFAGLFDFKVPRVRVKALGLNCGCYDGRGMALAGNDEVFLEYIDAINAKPSEKTLEMIDVLKYIDGNFPPSFVMSAANDFLLPAAEPMYEFLKAKGVPCALKIYGTKEMTEVGHVFHINQKLDIAHECNDDECKFFLDKLKQK